MGCERGTIETDRYDWREERLIEAGHEIGKKYGISYPAWNLTPEETKKVEVQPQPKPVEKPKEATLPREEFNSVKFIV